MYKRVFDIHAWKLSTHAFNEGDIRLYESLTSIGNGYMGMRGNFEEGFSGDSHTGTYIAGIWFPDKTRVGWWKNGYPKYFGKVINAVNFAAIGVEINGKTVDLHTSNFSDYYEELGQHRINTKIRIIRAPACLQEAIIALAGWRRQAFTCFVIHLPVNIWLTVAGMRLCFKSCWGILPLP